MDARQAAGADAIEGRLMVGALLALAQHAGSDVDWKLTTCSDDAVYGSPVTPGWNVPALEALVKHVTPNDALVARLSGQRTYDDVSTWEMESLRALRVGRVVVVGAHDSGTGHLEKCRVVCHPSLGSTLYLVTKDLWQDETSSLEACLTTVAGMVYVSTEAALLNPLPTKRVVGPYSRLVLLHDSTSESCARPEYEIRASFIMTPRLS